MQCFMWHFKLETRVFDNVYNTSKVGSWEGTNFFFSEGLFLKCFGRNYLPIGLHTQQLIHYVHTYSMSDGRKAIFVSNGSFTSSFNFFPGEVLAVAHLNNHPCIFVHQYWAWGLYFVHYATWLPAMINECFQCSKNNLITIFLKKMQLIHWQSSY